MDETANLKLPYIMAAQAQKHVTHNEAIRALDALVQMSVLDRDLTSPPSLPVNGDRYIVAVGGLGAWLGYDLDVVAYQDGAWVRYEPREGFIAWVADEDVAVVWNGAAWSSLGGGGGGGSVNPTPLVGVNATADTTNRLSVASPASLFNHDGAGHQQKINKALVTDTASVLYQTGFSGRAEIGTAGDDDFHFKVSADGTTWREAIVIDKDTGAVSFPNTTLGGGGGGSLTISIRRFAASGTYTPTTGMVYCIVEAVGGGGGGAGSAGNASFLTAGGCGGGGEYARSAFSATAIGASKAIVIGAGGAGSAAGGSGNAGQATTFGGTLLVANGGSGGGVGSSGAFGSPGNGGTGGTGQLLIPGMVGSWGPYNSGSFGFVPSGSSGGHSRLGSSARPITSPSGTATTGLAAAANSGGGGSAGMSNFSATSTAGGAGGSGVLIVTEFIMV